MKKRGKEVGGWKDLRNMTIILQKEKKIEKKRKKGDRQDASDPE